MTTSSSLKVALWSPAFNHHDGGIQQFSRLLARGLQDSPFVQSCTISAFVPIPSGRIRFILQVCLGLVFRRPDLVVITHLHLARLSFVLRFLNIPYWICVHGIECWRTLRKDDAASMAKAARILCVSRYTRDQLLEKNPGLSLPTVLFPNHVLSPSQALPTKEEARRRLLPMLQEPSFVLLIVSRLAAAEQYKGHRIMLKILHILKERGEKIHYLIAGEGDDRTALESLCESLDMKKCVTFLGRVDEPTLELTYAACDAFAMPSTGEGFGIVYLEALVRGRPVLAGNRDGSTDALKDGALGILVDPYDQESLMQGLLNLRLLAEKSNPEELKKSVLQEFGYPRLQERLDALLQYHLQTSCAE